MPIYIATLAGLLSIVVLVTVYLADRYEREPIELIQDAFLLGACAQLVLILIAQVSNGAVLWAGPWLAVTIVGAALYLPFHLERLNEMDERFDGIVYTVALLAGAFCVIHLNNLSVVASVSQHGSVLAGHSAPGIRDLLILVSSPAFTTELGQGLVVVADAILMGALLGVVHKLRWPILGRALVATVLGLAVLAIDLLTGGAWEFRAVLVLTALAAAAALKQRSVFKTHPQTTERDALVLGVKTLLMVLGMALLATAVLDSQRDPLAPAPEATTSPHERPAVERAAPPQ